MGRKIQVKTISLGSEPDAPDVDELAAFIADHRGYEADLISAQLFSSVTAQIIAGIDTPAAGGLFCHDRIEQAVVWDNEYGATVDPSILLQDMPFISRRGVRLLSVHESPSLIGTGPSPDDEEGFEEFCKAYSGLLRVLRDGGIVGHVLHTRAPSSIELELFSGPKTTLYVHDAELVDLEELLEVTGTLVIPADSTSMAASLTEQFQIRRLILVEPDADSLSDALSILDQDHIRVGGYATGPEEEYWKKIAESAVISE